MRHLAIVLVIIALTSIILAADPMNAEPQKSTYGVRLYLPADMVAAGNPVPVVIEVTNGSDKPLPLRHRVLSAVVDEMSLLKFPEGACLLLLVEPHGERYRGGGGSTSTQPFKDITIQPGESELVRGEVSQKDVRSPVFAVRAVLMLDGKQVATSPWSSDVSLAR